MASSLNIKKTFDDEEHFQKYLHDNLAVTIIENITELYSSEGIDPMDESEMSQMQAKIDQSINRHFNNDPN